MATSDARATQGVSPILLPELRAVIGDPETVREIFEELHPADGAELLTALSPEERQAVIEALPPAAAAAVLAALDPGWREGVLEGMPIAAVAAVLESMAPDDQAESLARLEPEVRADVLAHLSPAARSAAEIRLRHGASTAGRLMTDRYQAVFDDARAADALEMARAGARLGRSVATLFVVNREGLLRGRLTLRQILTAPTGAPVVELMDPPISVREDTDQEQVARLIAKYDLLAAPVVDAAGKLLGIVTIDDIVDVLIDEGTEDVYRMGAVQPLEAPYFATGFWLMARKRALWLLVLFAGELFTATALHHFGSAIEHAIALVIFIPLIISSGGNAGSQSATLITRGLAVGEIRPRHFVRVASREAGMGLALGAILGVIGFGRALVGGNGPAVALVVALTLTCVVTLGALVGGLLPLFFKRLGLDPAITSSPFVASIVDVAGIVCYFSLASAILGLG
jgi:magnesium transporter